MKKDKAWLKKEINKVTSRIYGADFNTIKETDDLIDQLDEPQKPVIPQFVADWVESRDYCNVYMVLQDLSAPGSPHASKDVRNWIFRNQENVEKFVRAWLDGYEVEKEKKYVIQISEFDFMVQDSEGLLFPTDLNIHNFKSEFTEAEIKAIDKRYWVFAKEVTE